MAARHSPELVGKLGKLIIIALIAALLITVVIRDPVGVWHLVVAVITFGLRLLNAVVVLLISLIGGASR
jgi:branched-subunit amino acid transport protein AzlD